MEFSATQLQAIREQAAGEESEEENSGNKTGGDDQQGEEWVNTVCMEQNVGNKNHY